MKNTFPKHNLPITAFDHSKCSQLLLQLFRSWTLDEGREDCSASPKEMVRFYESLVELIQVAFDPELIPEKIENDEVVNPPSDYFDKLITALKILIDPEMIFLFEIPLTGYGEIKSRKEVYMVIKYQNLAVMESIQGLLTFLVCEKDEVCIHPININFLKNELKDGNIFFLTHITHVNLIYKKSGTPELQKFQISNLPQLFDHALKVLQKGWKNADHFLNHAKLENGEGNFALAVYFLHQSIELRLRALVLAWERREKKTHEVRILIRCCLKFIPELAYIFQLDSEQDTQLLKILDDAYCNARYKSTFNILPAEAEKLLNKAIEIEDLCSSHYSKYLQYTLHLPHTEGEQGMINQKFLTNS